MVDRSGGRQGLLPGNDVYLKNNKDSFLGMGLAHAQKARQTSFFIKKRPIQVQFVWKEKHEQGDYKL